MKTLNNTHIVLAISGSIAAYKSAELTRLLRKAGAEVRVVMSDAACRFITPLTLQALSGHAVGVALVDENQEATFGHIALARWADQVLIAPASADTLAKLACGYADNLIGALCLATHAPITVCPAMNHQMWANAATQANCAVLASRGVRFIGPAQGEQACGEFGEGRMEEPMRIVAALQPQDTSLHGKRVLITAGPTQEALDPVRYLTNHSSGRMGYAVAQAAYQAGATVDLVSGPTALTAPLGVTTQYVVSALAMYDAVMALVAHCDIFIAAAAVADYRPLEVQPHKMKKTASTLTVELVKNPDILATVAALPHAPFCVGFAAETQDLAHYAQEKLQHKKLGLIAANRVDLPGQGFHSQNNALSLFWPGGQRELPLTDKHILAQQLVACIAERLPR